MITYLAIAGFLSAIVNLFLVIIVLWRNHKSKLNIVFSMACFTIMFYSFFYGLIFWPYPEDKELVLSFYQLATLGHLLTPALFFHFVALRLNVYEKYKRLIWLAYITLGFIALFSFTPLVVEDVVPKFSMPLWGVPGILWYAWSLIYSVYLTLVIYLLISHYRISTGIRREQIKYILIGSLIWVVSSGCNNLLWFNINFPPYLMIFTSTWGPIIVYSIVNYGLLDVKLILRKSTVYFLSIATIILGAQGIKIIVNYLISPATSIPVYGLNLLASINFWFDLPILIISLLIFQPIKDWYFKFANKYFFSSLYDSNELIADLSYKLRTTLDINMVFEYLIESLIKSFHVNSIGVCLYNQDKNNYEVQYNINFNFLARKEFPIDKKLFDRYLKKDRIVVVDEIKNFDYEENKAIVDVSDKFGVEVLVPLNFKYKIIGILLLGQKESKDVYNKEDIKTLGIISGIAANALENSKLYEDVSESNKNLKILLNAKSDFLRVVNHQLNTPLSIIKMGLESIKEKLMPWQKGFKIIEEGANRIGRVLSDFWIAYDLEGEKIKLVLERMDIKELIEMVIDEKKKMEIFKTKKLAINFTLPGFSPPLLLADHRRIAFVIASLLDNAIFYTDKGGVEISLALEKKGRTEFLKVYVTDTGAGMKEEDIPLLFKKFSRGTSASLLHPDGSGLRLYISKHIIEYSGGELKLEKTGLGKGSTFSFTLPLPANRKIQ